MAALVESGPFIPLEINCEGLKAKCEMPFTKNLQNNDVELFVKNKYNLNNHQINVCRDDYYNLWDVIKCNLDLLKGGAVCNNDGIIRVEDFEKEISEKTKLIAITQMSNVLGSEIPLKKIIKIAHEKNVKVLVDGCQGIAHLKTDVQDLNCDFYVLY